VLVVEDRYNIVFLETDSGRELLTLPGECEAHISPQGNILVTWCYQSEIRIWGATP
jgi:hypothetical protein